MDMWDDRQEKILGKIEKVDGYFVTKCWKWLRPWRAKGYGEVQYKDKRYRAHRFSYETFNGPIPSGHVVRQACTNVWCVNPAHLLVEPEAKKSRQGNRKLTTQQVHEIKELIVVRQLSMKAIAKRYDVSPAAIYAIKSGRSWTK
jgi:hypothetical protein